MTRNIYRKSNISKLGSHIVEGVVYPNLPSIAEEYGMPLNTVYKRYSRGCRGDELVPKKKHKNYVPPKKEIKYKFFVNGVGYKSYQDACRKNDVNYITFRKRYFVYGWSLERALAVPSGLTRGGQGTFTSRSITVENKQYNSIAAAARNYGLTPETVIANLNDGATINQAFKLEMRPTENSFEFEGKNYRDKEHLCRELKFPYTVLRNRLRKGLTIRESIDLGPNNLGNEGRYNQQIFERNPNLANADGKLYFASVLINNKQRYKIGITAKTIRERLSKEFLSYRLIKFIKKSLYQCYLLEKQLLNKFSIYRDREINPEQLDGYKEVFNFPDGVVENIKSILDKNLKII